MNYVWYILIVIGATAAFTVASIFVSRCLHARNLARYDNYDRPLSSQDQKYIEQAELDLETAAQVKTPRWYSILLYAGFLPALCLSWVILGVGSFCLYLIIYSGRSIPNDIIYDTAGDSVVVLAPTAIAGMFLAAVLLYGFSLTITKFSNFVALNSNMHGFDKTAVRQGLLNTIEHRIRSRELHTSSKFSADAFLRQINQSYRDGCLKCFYGCMLLALILGVFDLRSQDSFFPDRVVSSGAYFNLNPKQTIAYEDITHVDLNCYISDYGPKANYTLRVEETDVVTVRLDGRNIKDMAKVNAILREKKNIKFQPRQTKKGPSRLSATCIDGFGKDVKEPKLTKEILSLNG